MGCDHHGSTTGGARDGDTRMNPSPSPSPEAGKPVAPSAPVAPTPPALLSIEEFKRLALRVGVITAAENHPNADRLLVVKVDVGEGTPRQLVAGIRGSYEAADVVGKRVVVVANLKPATIRGVESQGMILATHDSSGLSLLVTERPIQPGSSVQ